MAISRDQITRLDAKLRRELGETVLAALKDERCEDIVLNRDSRLWAKRQNAGFECIGTMPATQAEMVLSTIAAYRETVISHERPILETELPLDGSRFEGLVPPVVRRPIFAIRLRPKRVFTLDEYERGGILTEQADARNAQRRRDGFRESVKGLPHAEILRQAVGGEEEHPHRRLDGFGPDDSGERHPGRDGKAGSAGSRDLH